MKVLYAINGFEQDAEPQLCLEGTCLEFENMADVIKRSIKNNELGEITRIGNNEIGNYELILVNNLTDNQLIKKIDSNKYLMSLDSKIWIKVLDIINPLLNQTGYQFIEFTDSESPINEDLGLIFRAIAIPRL